MSRTARSLPPGVLALLTLTAAAGAQSPPSAPPALSPEALAVECFDRGQFEQAARWLEEFLKDEGDTPRAGEACYRLAVAHSLRNEPDDAKRAFLRLVEKHPRSPWALVALRHHVDEPTLTELSKNSYAAARARQDAAAARQALDLLAVRQQRFPNGLPKPELLYKGGVCAELAGDVGGALRAFAELRQQHRDSPWAKLALVRQGGLDAFRAHLDDLLNTAVGEGEHAFLFRQLADRHEPQLTGDDRLRCRLGRARCLAAKEEASQRQALLRDIVADAPESPWAAEAAFWLAEQDFAAGKFAEAQQAYRQLAERHPGSPRAAQARQWADWVDGHDDCRRELEAVLSAVLHRLAAGKGGLAVELTGAGDGGHPLAARLAHQGEHMLLDVKYGTFALLLANNARGTFYRGTDPATLLEVKERFRAPAFDVRAVCNPASDQWSFNWNLTGDRPGSASTYAIDPGLAAYLAHRLPGWTHCTRSVTQVGDCPPRTVFRFELPRWEDHRLECLEVETEGTRIHSARLLWPRDGGRTTELRVTGVCLGDPVPASAFAAPAGAGVTVRQVEKLNPMEVFGHVMQLVGVLGQQVGSELQGR